MEKEGQNSTKGPQVMKGYWHRPDEDAKVIGLLMGYFKTGDVACGWP